MKDKKYKVNESNILFTELGEDGVIYHLENNEYFSLNETFSNIFKKIQSNKSPFHIIEELMEEYEIDRVTCEKEVLNVINELEAKKIIQISAT